MADELSKRCSRLHQHQHPMGGRAAAAAEYSVELCEAMCRGLRRQKDYDASGKASTRSLTRGEVKMVIGQLVKQEDDARKNSRAQAMSRRERMEYRRSLLSELLDRDRQVRHVVNGLAGEKMTDEINLAAENGQRRAQRAIRISAERQ